MANRPVYEVITEGRQTIKVHNFEFQWFPGFSLAQKQRCIDALHEAAKKQISGEILEVSSKSRQDLGVKMSAFNLKIILSDGTETNVENTYQAGKVFGDEGPYHDILTKTSREAQKDIRIKRGGLSGFSLEGIEWGLFPKTEFYDYLYMKALYQNKSLHEELMGYSAFTDIVFNPKKMVATQAQSAALYVSYAKRGLIDEIMSSPDAFKNRSKLIGE